MNVGAVRPRVMLPDRRRELGFQSPVPNPQPLQLTSPDVIHEEEALGKAYDGRLMRRLLRYARPYHALVFG